MIIQKGKSLTKIFYKIADDPHKYEILSLCKNNLIHVPTIARLTDEVNSKWGEPDSYLFSIISLIHIISYTYVLLFQIEVVVRKKHTSVI